MAAVIGFDKEKIMEICRQTQAQVANFNAPDQIVITGKAQNVANAAKIIQAQGAKRVIPLDVSGAFHSHLMALAVPKFENVLKQARFRTGDFPVVSNVDGQPTVDPEKIRQNLARQITSSVQWVDSVQYIAAQGITDFLEIGPGNVLKGLIRKINPALQVYNIRTPQDIDNLPF